LEQNLSKYQEEFLLQEEDSIGTSRQTIELAYCPLMNISHCPKFKSNLLNWRSLVIVIYNPLVWKCILVGKFVVTNSTLNVFDLEGNTLKARNATIDVKTREFTIFTHNRFHL
jgi:hypothetical protein